MTQTSVPAAKDGSFISPRDRREFWLFCAAVFLAFLTNSTTAYLSVILSAAGLPERAIGGILSSPLVPVTVAILSSGPLIARYSALRVAIVGQLISLGSFVGFQYAIPDAFWVGALRMTLGFGFGMFFPAGMVYAKSKLHGPKTTHLFGIYAVMVSLPVVIAPPLAEWYFLHFGTHYLFYCFAVPVAVGLLLMMTLRRDPVESAQRQTQSYASLLLTRAIALPNVSILGVGFMWGFVVSFMALFLFRSGQPAASFFSSCMLTVIASRTFVLGFLVRFPRELIVAAGLFGMALAYFILGTAPLSSLLVSVCAVMFGFGYSLTFPVLSVWISDQFEPKQRGRPVALFGAIFHVGIFSVPLAAGLVSKYLSLGSILICLAGTSVLLGAVLLWTHASNRERASARLSQLRGTSQ